MKALVTGGGGFLGGAIVRQLLARGDRVRSISRGDYPALRALGVELVRADLTERAAVWQAIKGCDVVFHVAARAGIWGRFDDFYAANVTGTQHILTGCLSKGVRRLVYTSSPSVVFAGQDMEGVDESMPYPPHFHAYYPQTKAAAEQLVRSANSAALATVSLRPHLIWGPGDHHLVPRIIARAKAGRLRRLGPHNKLIDTVYVDNAAAAHLLAADRLAPGAPIAGQVYFISQGEPVPLWDLVNRILAAAGLPPVTKAVPVGVAHAAGWLCETVYGLLRIQAEPPMTRFLASELSTAHWFNITAARRDLGYEPTVSLEEGLRRLRASFALAGVSSD